VAIDSQELKFLFRFTVKQLRYACHFIRTWSGLIVVPQSDQGPLEAAQAFIRGHNGVLLGMLCTSKREAEEVVLQALEGTTREDKLRRLIDTVRDFTGTLSTVATRYNGSIKDNANVAQPRGEQVVSDGVEVAKKVLDALQALL